MKCGHGKENKNAARAKLFLVHGSIRHHGVLLAAFSFSKDKGRKAKKQGGIFTKKTLGKALVIDKMPKAVV